MNGHADHRPRVEVSPARTAASYLGLARRARPRAANDNSRSVRAMFHRASTRLALLAVASAALYTFFYLQ